MYAAEEDQCHQVQPWHTVSQVTSRSHAAPARLRRLTHVARSTVDHTGHMFDAAPKTASDPKTTLSIGMAARGKNV